MDRDKGAFSFKKTIAVLAVATLLIGGGLSLYASSNPDGLEWSMGKVAGTEELEATGAVHETAEGIQNVTALLPDYGFKNSESAAGTSFSGVMVVVCVGVCYIIRFFKRKKD